jgi:hypothetical protein
MARHDRRPERRPARALLIAEAPARGRNRRALDGLAGDRLARYAGLDGREALLDAFDAWNLLGRWPGAEGKGSRWPADLARRSAARTPLSGVAVLLGGRVARAYGLERAPLGEWVALRSGAAARIPHPSGVCRTYNEAWARELAGAVLCQARDLASAWYELETLDPRRSSS